MDPKTEPTPKSEYVKVSFSLRRGTLAKLRAVAKAQHRRIDRMQSATVDQLIEDAFDALTPEQQRVAQHEGGDDD